MVIVRQKIIFKLSFHPTFCLKVDKKLKFLYDGIRLLTDIFFSLPLVMISDLKLSNIFVTEERSWTSASLLCGYFSRICVTYFIETHQQ